MSPLVRALQPMAATIRLLLPPMILLIGLWAGWMLFRTSPEPEFMEVAETPMRVRVIHPVPVDTNLAVTAFGTVKAARELVVTPQVAGRVIEVSDQLIPGGQFKQGQVMIRIDPRDYEYALKQAEASLETAKFNLEMEEGRGRVAQRDWELLGDEVDIDDVDSRMALRAPHLAEKQAALASAKSRVEKANLDLSRTVIAAPFDAMVDMESVEVGQTVSAGSRLATLVGTDTYRVEIGIPLDDVPAVVPADGITREASVTLATGGGKGVTYQGFVSGLTGSVDPAGRLARVLVVVPDPIGQSSGRSVPLLLDAYVEVSIEGPAVEQVLSLPRSVVREGDLIWVAGANNRLAFRSIEILGGDVDTVLARAPLAEDEAIITSPIPAAAPGMLLEREAHP